MMKAAFGRAGTVLVLVALWSGLEVTTGARAAAAKAQRVAEMQLKCTLSGGPAMFAEEFCRALAGNLARDLGLAVRVVDDWSGSGAATSVALAMSRADRASVQVTIGDIEGGVLRVRSTTTTILSSRDRPLTPASSRALVRGIGVGLGMV